MSEPTSWEYPGMVEKPLANGRSNSAGILKARTTEISPSERQLLPTSAPPGQRVRTRFGVLATLVDAHQRGMLREAPAVES